MNKTEFLNLLRNKPIFWSKLGIYVDADKNGLPVNIYGDEYEKYQKFHYDFQDADVPIHTCILHSGWIGDGIFDYTVTDKILDTLLKDGKIKYFMPRIKLNVPIDWCYNNPEELLVYYDGPRTAQEIRELVDTPKHDFLGYNAPNGVYNPGKVVDSRPNVGGLISRQSFSSSKWLCDAGNALTRLIRHIEDGPYGDRVIAYHIAYGASGESMLWGRENGKFADYGISNQKLFYKWYKENIDKDAVWENGDFVPSPSERLKNSDDILMQFKSKKEDKRAIAYDTFMTEVNVNAINHFAEIVKKESGKAVGAFYGYLLHVTRSAYTGFLGWHKMLNESKVDFVAAPKSYYRSNFGQSGGEMVPFLSINKKMLWIDECDIRTHNSLEKSHGFAENMEQTRYMLWREYVKNTAHNSGSWWMDLGTGWYDDPEIMSEIKKISRANERIKANPFKTGADILYVVDEESFKYSDERFNQRLIEGTYRQLQLTGCAIDVALQSELEETELKDYKLIVFANAYCMTKEELKQIESKTDAKFLFSYAAGIVGDEKTSLENCEKLTGFKYTAQKGEPAELEISGTSDRYFYNTYEVPETDWQGKTVKLPSVPYLRSIAEKSNCHLYSEENTFIYAENRIVGVFTDKPQKVTLNFKETSNVKDLITNEIFNNVSSLELELENSFKVFEII